MTPDPIPYDHGITAIDSGYLRPRLDAVHVIVHRGRAAIVDTGTNQSVPAIFATLADQGIAPDDVDWVVLTHVHLDHAGGAGLLMQRCPNAKLVVHPRGAPHMIDPAKLWAGTVAVYGEARARADYGELIPVPKARVLEATDGSSIELAGRTLSFIDSPGHARHHVAVFDPLSRGLFTGDTFGLSYRELDRDDRAFIFPTTTPTQFDPPALHATVDRLLALDPAAIYLTHYSRVTDLARLGTDLHRLIDAHADLASKLPAGLVAEGRSQALRGGVRRIVIDEARRQGGDPERWQEILSNDIDLNGDGLASWLDSRDRLPR